MARIKVALVFLLAGFLFAEGVTVPTKTVYSTLQPAEFNQILEAIEFGTRDINCNSLTVNGVVVANTINASVYFGDGSQLTGISGGSISSENATIQNLTSNMIHVDNLYLTTLKSIERGAPINIYGDDSVVGESNAGAVNIRGGNDISNVNGGAVTISGGNGGNGGTAYGGNLELRSGDGAGSASNAGHVIIAAGNTQGQFYDGLPGDVFISAGHGKTLPYGSPTDRYGSVRFTQGDLIVSTNAVFAGSVTINNLNVASSMNVGDGEVTVKFNADGIDATGYGIICDTITATNWNGLPDIGLTPENILANWPTTLLPVKASLYVGNTAQLIATVNGESFDTLNASWVRYKDDLRISANISDLQFTILHEGLYQCKMELAFSFTASNEARFAWFKNGIEQTQAEYYGRCNSSGLRTQIGGTKPIYCVPGDVLTVKGYDSTSYASDPATKKQLTIRCATLEVTRESWF